MQKRILQVAGLGCAMAVVLLAIGAYLVIRAFVLPEFSSVDTAQDVGKPGVRLGKGFLRPSVFLKDDKLGFITDIALGKVDSNPKVDMVIAGRPGADFVSGNGKTLSRCSFPDDLCLIPQVVDVESDGVCEFLNRDGPGGPSLLDHHGKLLWAYRAETQGGSADNACAGDLNGDGFLKFAVGFCGHGGVRILDHRLHLLHQAPDGNVWCTRMTDLDQDGHLEVVIPTYTGISWLLDSQGRVKSETRLSGPGFFGHYLGNFSITKSAGATGKLRALCDPTRLRVTDYHDEQRRPTSVPPKRWTIARPSPRR